MIHLLYEVFLRFTSFHTMVVSEYRWNRTWLTTPEWSVNLLKVLNKKTQSGGLFKFLRLFRSRDNANMADVICPDCILTTHIYWSVYSTVLFQHPSSRNWIEWSTYCHRTRLRTQLMLTFLNMAKPIKDNLRLKCNYNVIIIVWVFFLEILWHICG